MTRPHADQGPPWSPESAVRAYLDSRGRSAEAARMQPLAGDASTRRYFRLAVPFSNPPVILAAYPPEDRDACGRFLAVARVLEDLQIPVPAVIGHADTLGVVELEDLGDRTLQSHLETCSDAERAARYEEALGPLVALHRATGAASPTQPAGPPWDMRFDVATFVRELQFFTTHFLEGLRGVTLAPETRQQLAVAYERLAASLAGGPQVLCHRDYHSRNLMVHAGRLYVIDFQDARLGPDTYDLASLLCDAYVDLPAEQTAHTLARYRARVAQAGGQVPDGRGEGAYQYRFWQMAAQRSLKALGTFGFQATVRGRSEYLSSVPRSLGHARRSLPASAEGRALQALLAPLLPELD